MKISGLMIILLVWHGCGANGGDSPIACRECIWSPVGEEVVVFFRHSARLLSVPAMSLKHEIPAGRRFFTHAAFSFDGMRVAIAEIDGTVSTWDSESPAQVKQIMTSGPVMGIAFCEQKLIILDQSAKWYSGDGDGLAQMATDEPVTQPIWRASASKDGKYWVTIPEKVTRSQGAAAEVWEIKAGNRIARIGVVPSRNGLPLCAKITTSGDLLLSISEEGVVYIPRSHLQTDAITVTKSMHDCVIAISGDERMMCVLDTDGDLEVGAIPNSRVGDVMPVMRKYHIDCQIPAVNFAQTSSPLSLSPTGDRLLWIDVQGNGRLYKIPKEDASLNQVWSGVIR